MIISREDGLSIDCAFVPAVPDRTCAFNLATDGFYWRTSNILQCDITFPENDGFTKITYSPEPDKISDEYDVLAETISSLKKFSHIITFNGNSFALPYLRNKSAAYEICYNLDKIQSSDLYILFKSLYHLLRLPSRKLKDYLNFLEYKGNDDSAGIMTALSLQSYIDFLNGGYTLSDVTECGDDIVFSFVLNKPVPRRISFPFQPFYLVLNGSSGKLSSKIFDGSVRLYHTDFKSYDYLINEGYAVHKSISAFIDKNKKKQADRDTAFTYIRLSETFFSNTDMQKDYLNRTLLYLCSLL